MSNNCLWQYGVQTLVGVFAIIQISFGEESAYGSDQSRASSVDTIQQLDDLEVREKRDKSTSPIKQSNEISKVELRPEQIQKLTTVGESDISRALQLLPGVSAANENSAGLFIRGSTPDQNLILFDDFIVPNADHLFGFNSAFNANSVGSVALYKGGFPVKYGGRTSGVLELKGKEGNTERFTAASEIGFISAMGNVELPLFSHGAIHVGGRTSYTGLLQMPLFTKVISSLNPNNGSFYQDMKRRFANLTHTYPYNFYDVNATAFYKPGESSHLKYSLFTSNDTFGDHYKGDTTITFPGPNPVARHISMQNDINNRWNNFGNSVSFKQIWSDDVISRIGIGYSQYADEKENANKMQFDTLFRRDMSNKNSNELITFNGKIDNDYTLNEMNIFNIGTEIISTASTYTVEMKQNDSENSDSLEVSAIKISDTAHQVSGYLNDQISFMDKFKLTPGLRITYYTGTHEMLLEPRVHGSVTVSSNLTLSAAWGKYNQYVNKVLHENFFSGDNYFWFNADDKHCNIIKAQHIIGSVSYSTPLFHIGLEAYRIDRKGLAHYVSSRQSMDDLEVSLFYDGTSITDGVEILLQKKVGMYTGWLSYTWNRTVDNFPDLYFGKSFPDAQDRTNALTFVNTVSKWWFDLSAIWIYSTGLPYTKLISTYQVLNGDGNLTTFCNVGTKNGYRLADYHRFDVSLMYTVKSTNKYSAQIGAALFNVYNRQNDWNTSYVRIPVMPQPPEYDGNSAFGPPGPGPGPGQGRTIIQQRTAKFWGATPSVFIKMNF